MNVLITGSEGYIGRVMEPILRRGGFHVRGLDTGWFSTCTFGVEALPVCTLRKDLRNVEREDLIGVDAIVHLAGICNDPLGDLNPAVTLDINHSSSLRLAEIAKEAGVRRFVFSSSCSIYGGSGEDLLDEAAPVQPLTVYARSKVMLEADLSAMAGGGFCPVYLRNATVYGSSPGLRLDLVLNDLVASAYLQRCILIRSDGTPWRPIVHVEDVCQAFLAALRAPEKDVFNQAFNVGATEENYRIRNLADIVAETVPDSFVAYAPGGGPDQRCYRVDCSKIRRVLPEFEPRWTARAGAAQLYESFRRGRLGPDDLPRFCRLARIRELQAQNLLDDDLQSLTGHDSFPAPVLQLQI